MTPKAYFRSCCQARRSCSKLKVFLFLENQVDEMQHAYHSQGNCHFDPCPQIPPLLCLH